MAERVYAHAAYQGLWVKFHSHAWKSIGTHAQPSPRHPNFHSYEWKCISAPQKSRCSAPSSIPRRAS